MEKRDKHINEKAGPAPEGDGARLHPFTKLALGAALLGLGVNLLMVACRFFFFPLYMSLSIDNLVIMGLLAMAVYGPGLHGLIKSRIPGASLVEKRMRPNSRDVRHILTAFGVMAFNLFVALLFAHATISMMARAR